MRRGEDLHLACACTKSLTPIKVPCWISERASSSFCWVGGVRCAQAGGRGNNVVPIAAVHRVVRGVGAGCEVMCVDSWRAGIKLLERKLLFAVCQF